MFNFEEEKLESHTLRVNDDLFKLITDAATASPLSRGGVLRAIYKKYKANPVVTLSDKEVTTYSGSGGHVIKFQCKPSHVPSDDEQCRLAIVSRLLKEDFKDYPYAYKIPKEDKKYVPYVDELASR